jgi:transposase
MNLLWDHTRWNFLDEKHMVNHDALLKKGRADPLMGYINYIPVMGDFREAYYIFVVISGNPAKDHLVEYRIDIENGSASTFVLFITALVISGFFNNEEILVMDNARIHTGEEAAEVWRHFFGRLPSMGRPLYVLVIYLPTRSPELNPIEFIFHILTARIRSFRYRTAGPCDKVVKEKAKKVFNDMDYALILCTYLHCGY